MKNVCSHKFQSCYDPVVTIKKAQRAGINCDLYVPNPSAFDLVPPRYLICFIVTKIALCSCKFGSNPSNSNPLLYI